VTDARRVREFEGENGKLKKVLAEAMLAVEPFKASRREKGKPIGPARGGAGEDRDIRASSVWTG
jgi:hypothetical protein